QVERDVDDVQKFSTTNLLIHLPLPLVFGFRWRRESARLIGVRSQRRLQSSHLYVVLWIKTCELVRMAVVRRVRVVFMRSSKVSAHDAVAPVVVKREPVRINT